jgi:peptidoglycan/LPS O-acetylase OafA/YrhL
MIDNACRHLNIIDSALIKAILKRGFNMQLSYDKRIEVYPAIDSLRGWAIFLVIATHTSQWINVDSHWLKQLILLGFTGVSLFFIVSAMTLCMAHERRTALGIESTGGFFIRRIFRIFPMWWIVMSIYLWEKGLGPRDWAIDGINLTDVFLTAVGAHGWHPILVNAIMPIGWTVGVELSFYLLFPLLFVLLRSLPAIFIFIVLSLWLSPIWEHEVLTHMYTNMPFTPHYQGILHTFAGLFSLPPQLAVFGFGFLTYYLLKRFKDKIPKAMAIGMIFSAIGLYILFSFTPVIGVIRENVNVSSLVLYSIMYMLFCLGLLNYNMPFFDNPITRWVGKVSYSAYLLHVFITHILGGKQWFIKFHPFYEGSVYPPHGDFIYGFALLTVLVITIAISSITYLFIELPMIRLGARYSLLLSQSKK